MRLLESKTISATTVFCSFIFVVYSVISLNNLNHPKFKFKVDFFYHVIDVTLSSLDERFGQYQYLNENFGFLCDISKNVDFKDCEKLEAILTARIDDEVQKDVIARDLLSEINIFNQTSNLTDLKPLSILNYLASNHLLELYPNLTTALKILLTFPVSVATGEASFSKLKIIKSYLRSTMTEERLTALATISIEKDMLNRIEEEEIATRFAKMKSRRAAF